MLPSTEDDPRLVPAYTADDDSADDPEGSVVAFELGPGPRAGHVRRGPRRGAIARWADGDFGPRVRRWPARPPAPCVTCGFWLPLAGSLRQRVGACGNAYAPADGRVVTADYGCGAHSQATLVAADTSEVIHTARYDTGTYDVLSD